MRPDDRVYSWHIPLKAHAPMHRLATQYQWALSQVPQLRLCTPPWLRLPLRDLGPATEIRYTDVQDITAAVQERLTAIPVCTLTTGEVIRRRGTLSLEVHGDLRPLQRTLEAAVASVLGWRPRWHRPPRLLLAHHTESVDPLQLRRVLSTVQTRPVDIRVDSISLALLRWHSGQHLWSELDRVALAEPANR